MLGITTSSSSIGTISIFPAHINKHNSMGRYFSAAITEKFRST